MFYLRFVKALDDNSDVQLNLSCESYYLANKDIQSEWYVDITTLHKEGSSSMYERHTWVAPEGHHCDPGGEFYTSVYIMNNEGKTIDRIINHKE